MTRGGEAAVPAGNVPISRPSGCGAGLARPLLALALMLGTTVSAGCIIPVPLDREGAPKNHTPQILVDQSSPTFGRIRHAIGDIIAFSITVEDPDLARLENPDTIYARLLRSAPSGDRLVYLFDSSNISPLSDDPERVSGSFPELQYCLIFSNAPSTDMVVVASDRPFVDPKSDLDPALSPGGATDRRQWTLECQ